MIDTRDTWVEQLGRYQLLRHLATGGMAEIWLASVVERRRNEPEQAVIKVIAPERARDRQFVQMFLDEARVAATLHHPNIAALYEVGFENDTYFHAMEYVHGENVRAAIERSIIVRKPTPLAAAIAVGRSIAAALHYAHERCGATGEPLGIVHRDVTPSNIMIGWDGVVKLVDFGVALAAGRAQETRTGVVKGKLAYMSPEQCRGLKADRRTDVFALGVLVYELSLQKRAFLGDSEYQTMERIVRGDLMPPRQVRPDYPPALEKIVLRAMATDLNERYATAAEMGAALAEFAKAEGLAEGPSVTQEYMRGLFGEGRERAPSAPMAPAEMPVGTLNGTGDTRESPAALAAAALAPRVASRVFAPTGPMPIVAKPGPTAAIDAQRPAVFAFGTLPTAPARMPTAPEQMRSRVGWIVAAAVLVAGVVVAMAIVLSSGGAKPTAPAPETGNRQPATGNRQLETDATVAPAVAPAPQAEPAVDSGTSAPPAHKHHRRAKPADPPAGVDPGTASTNEDLSDERY